VLLGEGPALLPGGYGATARGRVRPVWFLTSVLSRNFLADFFASIWIGMPSFPSFADYIVVPHAKLFILNHVQPSTFFFYE
jgi:hypothetical protein